MKKDSAHTLRNYIFGYAFSMALTVCAFVLVELHLSSAHEFPSHEFSTAALVVLAIIQLVAQMLLFLHIGEEDGPRWKLLAFAYAAIIVCILVGGTLWIMSNLSHMQEIPQQNVFEEENIFPTSTNAY